MPRLEAAWRKPVVPDALIVGDPVGVYGSPPGHLPRLISLVMDYLPRPRAQEGDIRLTLRLGATWRQFLQAQVQAAKAYRGDAQLAVQQGVQATLRGQNPGSGVAPDARRAFLGALSPDQLDTLAVVGAEEPGLISGNTDSHEKGRVLFRTPLTGLTPGVRETVLRGAHNTGVPFPLEGTESWIALNTSHGYYRLELRSGEERTLLQSGGAVARAMRAANTHYQEALTAQREWLSREQQPLPGWLDPQTAPLPRHTVASWKQAAVEFPASVEAGQDATRVLAEFSIRTGVPVVADAFLRSTYLSYPERGVKTDLTPAPPAIWARRIAQRFRRYYRVVDGVLLLQSRERWWDRYVEPEQRVLAALEEAWDSGRNACLADYVWCGRLREEQLRELPRLDGVARRRYNVLVMNCLFQWPLVRFLGDQLDSARLMGKEEETRALAANPEADREFSRLLWGGEPVSTPEALPPGRQLRWRLQGNTATVEFLDGRLRRGGRHELLGQRPASASVPIRK